MFSSQIDSFFTELDSTLSLEQDFDYDIWDKKISDFVNFVVEQDSITYNYYRKDILLSL